ncbi:hypothetical protein LS77_002405 [Helicobacter bilis]|uniref:Uncharacterized protein n=2 Tax=Helicobacter bilis TaxID=37372 RepID=A0A6D2CDJ2_9HELI|nr:YceI family protein [Helicobacter bilis]EMZ37762.1 hypothetical protein C826_01842 [Helicobacter bilis WiWa]TLE05061.1 hypothetical protein LS76_006450 [Helicobacter bilis]TLE05785.1 hypothetical protein LS77_002405 [Helicobacter bilis]
MKKFVLMALSLSFLSLCFGKDFSGKLTLTDKAITALSGEVRIESIFTDSTKRDKHCKKMTSQILRSSRKVSLSCNPMSL